MLKDDWFTVRQIDDKTYAISELGHLEKEILLKNEKPSHIKCK